MPLLPIPYLTSSQDALSFLLRPHDRRCSAMLHPQQGVPLSIAEHKHNTHCISQLGNETSRQPATH
ncbi:hypothetical protein E2C01_021332 [Portunus trituberculatus]|uniref:Uncharacterized protein n=1 Tax=Portunus trituberculatus TaxID=210409 RepID=A0A5B7E463_PORTR|nr:hypothetical protein [Portunus trituberculatus]